jgi:L-alanine-DL-glutamate epimerase-like enolase superfamily enzyme
MPDSEVIEMSVESPTPTVAPRSGSEIVSIYLHSYELTYAHGVYVMSGGRRIQALQSTVAHILTADGCEGYGETCPLGSNYLPAHAAGARAALEELAPQIIGMDATNPAAVVDAMDHHLTGHPYAKSALDVACWDAFGHTVGRPVCDLLGGRQVDSFPLYVAIPLGPPEQMRADVQRHREGGVKRFQLKLGGDPAADAARVTAVLQATGDEDLVVGDANGGWRLRDAVLAARMLEGSQRFMLEQPCPTFEECLQVRAASNLPMILDEVIVDLQSLLRAWDAQALEAFNLKINRVGGLTKARLLRDVGQELGITVNVEDSWGGDLTTAAVSHLAASTRPEAMLMVSFMNDWTNEHVAGYEPRSANGQGAAPCTPGLGVSVDPDLLGPPFASYASGGRQTS